MLGALLLGVIDIRASVDVRRMYQKFENQSYNQARTWSVRETYEIQRNHRTVRGSSELSEKNLISVRRFIGIIIIPAHIASQYIYITNHVKNINSQRTEEKHTHQHDCRCCGPPTSVINYCYGAIDCTRTPQSESNRIVPIELVYQYTNDTCCVSCESCRPHHIGFPPKEYYSNINVQIAFPNSILPTKNQHIMRDPRPCEFSAIESNLTPLRWFEWSISFDILRTRETFARYMYTLVCHTMFAFDVLIVGGGRVIVRQRLNIQNDCNASDNYMVVWCDDWGVNVRSSFVLWTVWTDSIICVLELCVCSCHNGMCVIMAGVRRMWVLFRHA